MTAGGGRGPLLEAVPNFSEGRRDDVLRAIAAAAVSVPGCRLLHLSSDVDHHRAVVTLAGHEDDLLAGIDDMAGAAIERVDLRTHRGVHPRIGALDVLPFIPLGTSCMEDAVAAARRAGERLAERHDLPVFLYGRAAGHPVRARLADLRRGGPDALAARMAEDPAWAPDFGPNRLHPSAGAVAVGARDFLVAFNVLLETGAVEIARSIAREVRESSGGLPGVQALGLALESRECVQVSMNLTALERTTMADAFRAVRDLAIRHGVAVRASELVGLTPEHGLGGATPDELGLVGFGPDAVLEERLRRAGLLLA